MTKTLITHARIVNEGKIFEGSILIEGEYIAGIYSQGAELPKADNIIDAKGKYLLPGAIDDQVHFRDPGLTHKADIYTESRAAVAGGVTSFMDMPNTVPNTLTQELLEEKYEIAANKSLANFSFYIGASNTNLDEVVKTNPRNVCGVKIFMGSSTGNMLVNDTLVLEQLFAQSPVLIAVHAEDEDTIKANTQKAKEQFGDNPPMTVHPQIRSVEACYKASSQAVALAQKHGTRLHILHLTTAQEMELFNNNVPLAEKKITAEVCIPHLWFTDEDYQHKGTLIKCNPAVKSAKDREALWKALLDDKIDVVATDHAPHTKEEKENTYFASPSGMPMVQHVLPAMLEMSRKGAISIEKVVEKMCHNPAILFQIENRGFIRTGYFADLVLIDLDFAYTIEEKDILYKCGWSPIQGETLHAKIEKVFVNGHLTYNQGIFDENKKGKRLLFNR